MTKYKHLEDKIRQSYEEGTTLEVSERLAAEFLSAQISVSADLAAQDLNVRMRKSGLKAVKAAIYIEAATKDPKKPTEAMLSALVDTNDVVQGEQNSFDKEEVEKNELERLYDVFREAHIYYRGVAKGRFE